jgi:hypothetical protein
MPAVSINAMRWLLDSIVLTAALPLAAQTGQPVQLELKCGTVPCRFQIGEVIPIELSFTSSVPKHYQLNMARYDRSGRMNYETFRVTPQEGTRDPLQTYFAFGGFMGGGLTNFQPLSTEPATIKLVLNEWVSLVRPGIYRLTVTSVRVTDATGNWNEAGKSPEVVSNEIELEIVPPDSEWQERELRRIKQALDDPKRKPETTGSAGDPLVALRYLGTQEAALELARRLGTTDTNTDFECMFGLIGSPNSAAGLAEMDALLREPNFPVTSMFLRTMSYLSLRAGEAPDVLQKQREENMESARTTLIAALPLKRGKALALSTETALEGISGNSPESLRKMLSRQLLANFDALPAESQAVWLQYRWDLIKDRSWIPVLQKIATTYQDYPELREMHAYQSLQASGAALRRWHELDPEGARRAVIAEIVRARPRYGTEMLGILKDASLPEVDTALVENLAATNDYEIESNILALLERYGTDAAVPELISRRGELVGKWACAPQTSFLGYILKFDSDAARSLIERAIQARGEGSNACRHSIFMDLASKHRSSMLEELAINSLTDSDPEVGINAATYLGRYGSEAAEEPLWTQYMSWNRKWRGRERELRIGFGANENPNLWEANLGQALARALAAGNGWSCDEAKLYRILDLAVGEYVRSVVESALGSSSERCIMFVAGSPDRPASFTLAQYDQLTLEQLQRKLAQFPTGTLFQWTAAEPSISPEQEKAFREVSDAAAKAGLKLVRDSAQP